MTKQQALTEAFRALILSSGGSFKPALALTMLGNELHAKHPEFTGTFRHSADFATLTDEQAATALTLLPLLKVAPPSDPEAAARAAARNRSAAA